jgi:sugar lactone lactonase YvrE/enterochelin esterase-like enzyme
LKRRTFLRSALAAGAAAATPIPFPTASAAEERNVGSAQVQPRSQAQYALGPNSKPQPGVPRGETSHFALDRSTYFPGTRRQIDLYIPAQYQAKRPACVWISFDRLFDSLPAVFDTLIHKKEMPVTLAIGLHPGTVASADPPNNPRFNRSFEFDSLTDVMAQFILEELFSAVERQKTHNGLSIRLSRDPNDCGITGASSGGIAAFTAAWQRPDAFRRVYTMIGTYVGMRAGDRYPVLVRKTEAKPLRVFIQDNNHDGWPGGLELGDWWMSNQEMVRALTFAGYAVNHSWGTGGHDTRPGEAILPEVMRWLWKDWPKPIAAGKTANFAVQAIAAPGEDWKLVFSGARSSSNNAGRQPSIYASPPVLTMESSAGALAIDQQGRVYVQNPSTGEILRIGSGRAEPFIRLSAGINSIAFGPDGKLYVAERSRSRIVACGEDGKVAVVAEGVRGCGMTVTHDGDIYVTESGEVPYSGKIWLIRRDGTRSVVAQRLNGPSGVRLSPDGLWLFAGESRGHHLYSYRVGREGHLEDGEPSSWLHVPDSANDSGVTQICMDRQGWTYAATRMGIQVLDRNGRVTAILPVAGRQLAGICFGDEDFRTLYVSTGDAVDRRRVKTTGMPPWEKPITLPRWGAG